MQWKIEILNDGDLERRNRLLVQASEVVAKLTGRPLCGEDSDLILLQRAADAGAMADRSESLAAFALAFGQILISTDASYAWCVVDDFQGRDIAILHAKTKIPILPYEMIMRRLDNGLPIDFRKMYESLQRHLVDSDSPYTGKPDGAFNIHAV